MKRIIAAALLAGLAGTTLAQDVTVGLDQSCPAGTQQLVRTYSLDGSRLVETGNVCKPLLRGD